MDEYQDTNVAQYLWLRLLAQGHRNICCVGDDDQSIYSWRGAEVGNILRFEHDFPGAKIVRLEQNYRSTPHILAAASGLIAHNEGRLGKTLWTEANEGEKVRLRAVWDSEAEARWVGDEIESLQRKGEALAETAILVRAGFQTREFEERFIQIGLPYRIIGGPRFYERQEIRDALAYLRLIHQPADDLAFERIVNVPRRGIGEASLQTLHAAARAQQVPLIDAAHRLIETDGDQAEAARKALRDFLLSLERWRGQEVSLPHTELAALVFEESGYLEMWQTDKSADAPGRVENVKELVAAMAEFENLGGFLEHVSLVMDAAESGAGDMVNVMTLHSAKGLEFDSVFLPGWEEGVFPNQRALEESGLKALEEERRLAYVGLTRARKRASVSFAANTPDPRATWQSSIPSRFVEELPAEHVEMLAEAGLMPGLSEPRDLAGWGKTEVLRAPRWSPRSGAPLIEGRAVPVRGQEVRRAGGFRSGDRIFHQKFGYGTIQRVEDNKLATIAFDKAGDKMVMDSFVERA